jgi:hypothetical protein
LAASSRTLQLDGRVVKRRSSRAELIAGPQLRPHAAQQLGDAQRLLTQSSAPTGSPSSATGGQEGDDDAHVVAPLVAEVGQNGDVALRNATVENDEIRVGLDR